MHIIRLRRPQLVLLATAATPAALAQAHDCAIHPHDAACHLDAALHLLYWMAGALACLLLAAILLARIIYRRTKAEKLARDE